MSNTVPLEPIPGPSGAASAGAPALRTAPPADLSFLAALTPLGDTAQTFEALCAGHTGLSPAPVLGEMGGEQVPLCLFAPMREGPTPRWLAQTDTLAATLPQAPWGTASHPVFVSSSNFGVGSLLAFRHSADASPSRWCTPEGCVRGLAERYGWGADCTILSHACVSAQLALFLAAHRVCEPGVDAVLVFSFDCLSPFVAGGFHALKILNGSFPAPYADREEGAIGLGEGLAAAVVTRPGQHGGALHLPHQVLYNELYHMTANAPDGSGFRILGTHLARWAAQRTVWVKGHGTGTLEAGRLEAEAVARDLPGAPLVSWKGALGHTLGSCALVELALAAEALKQRQLPGTVGTRGATFTENVQRETCPLEAGTAALLLSNAFGGAHAACMLETR